MSTFFSFFQVEAPNSPDRSSIQFELEIELFLDLLLTIMYFSYNLAPFCCEVFLS